MFIDHAIIDLFFRLLNLGVFVALCVYVFKRYGVDAITELMRERARHKKNLLDQQAALAWDRELAQKAAQEQELLARRLRTNMIRWREQFSMQVICRAQEKERLLQIILRKSAMQQQQLAASAAADRVLARSIATARLQLREHFADASFGQAFVRDIVMYLKKSGI